MTDSPRAGMANPPQVVHDLIDLSVKYEEARGIGCSECQGGLPSDAAKRGHDRHPKDCKGELERNFGAYAMRTFLEQPDECWYGLFAAPADLSALEDS